MRSKIQKVGLGMRTAAIIVFVYAVIIGGYFVISGQGKTALMTDEQLISGLQAKSDKQLAETAKNTPNGQLLVTLNSIVDCTFVGHNCGDSPMSNHFSESLIGKATDVLTYPLTNPPASGIYWTMTQLEKAHLVPQSYAAQGIGFTKMQAFANVWLAFRNIAFTLMVLGIVTIGFMVIFRLKINPQVSISLENSLPRIFVSMLLVSFSFAIAGFMIDIMYFVMLTGISVIAQADPSGTISPQIEHYRYLNARGGELLDGMWNVSNVPWIFGLLQFFQVGEAIFQSLPIILSSSIKVLSALIMTVGSVSILGPVILGPFGSLFKGWSLAGFGLGDMPDGMIKLLMYPVFGIIALLFTFTWGGGFILAIVMFLTLLMIFARMYVLLFQSYIKILLYVIFSPMYILLNIIPGNNAFTGWLRGLAGELSVFPVTVFVMLVGKLIYKVVVSSTSGSVWTPPFVSGIPPEPFGIIISFVILFQTPDIVKFVRMKINGNRQSPINFGLGTLLGAAAVGGGAAGNVLSSSWRNFSHYTIGPRMGTAFGAQAGKIPVIGKYFQNTGQASHTGDR